MEKNPLLSIEQSVGVPMPFTRHLLGYLSSRPGRSQRFRLGHWLQALCEAELDQLRRLLDSYLDGGEDPCLDDMAALAVHCLAAEDAKPGIGLQPGEIDDWVAVLYVSASIEFFRRRGWLVPTTTLSISPNTTVRCAALEPRGPGLQPGVVRQGEPQACVASTTRLETQ